MITRKYIIIFLILSLSFALNLTGTARSAFAITISASATWAGEPVPVATDPYTVVNGDFTIIGSAGNPIVGDGSNEDTDWTFNFNSDPNYEAFFTAGKITSAILYMTLIPKDIFFDGDKVRMVGIPISEPDILINPPSGGWSIDTEFYFSADFMQSGAGYTSENILEKLISGGTISMHFYDDAWVKKARLDFTAVPIPGAVWLLGSGLLGLAGLRRFRQS